MVLNERDARVLIGFMSYLVSVDLLDIPNFINILDKIESSLVSSAMVLNVLVRK